jgi:transcriptional regulator with PAS, ATPase and Fis domain
VRTPDGLRVRDVGSTNGLRVGGVEIREGVVSPGAVLRVGEVEVLVGVAIDRLAVPISASDHFELAIGRGEELRRVFGVLERVAKTPASILLTGETGTGKDVLARSIHLRSGRRGPFEVIDCGAIVPSLIESELFGHERGSFTGAVSSRIGAFERAAGGTLFLDELAELPLELQPKLLRVLEARAFRRIGGDVTIASDVRIVAATSRDLREEVAAGRFREDLYYRLAVVSLALPPLRERREDLAVLTERFLEGTGLSAPPKVIAQLAAHTWPGNVRELRNVLERAVAVCQAVGDGQLSLVDFPPRTASSRGSIPPPQADAFDPALSYRETRAAFEAGFEERFVRWLIARHAGNVSAAAREARMDRTHLTDLIRKHGVRTK